MTKSVQKICLSVSRDLPLDKLVLSQANVRRIKAGVAIEELAEDIARRTLLQSLTVRAVLDDSGAETGLYEVPAGGRRFRALELLVKQKRLAKNAPIPCVIREGGIAEEDSLAENVQRAPLHPLDQFRAFLTLRERGQSEEEIAAVFFVTAAVVKQRLRLASVSPALLDVYAEDGMTLDQLMAFTVHGDHERQDAVWEAIQRSYSKEPYAIRRMLTEGAVRASDKRAAFVGLEAYEEAGGIILRDLFQSDDGGWLQDAGLLNLLVAERLREEADTVRAEGWRWVEAAPEFAYGHTYGLRGIVGERHVLTDEEEAAREALVTEYAGIEAANMGDADLPDEVDARLGEIEKALEGYDHRPATYRPEDLAIAGAFVGIDAAGGVRVERGYVRPEDELPVAVELAGELDGEHGGSRSQTGAAGYVVGSTAADAVNGMTGDTTPHVEPEEDEGFKPLPDRLLTELTAHRTLALRDAVSGRPDVAYLAVLHALCLQTFYRYALDSCVEITAKSVAFASQAPGLNDSASAVSIDARHQALASEMPADPAELWDRLATFDDEVRGMLLAHCVGQSINAVHEAYNRRPKALAHADRLAEAVNLDMVAAGWRPTSDTFLGRVTKARIVEAVREGRGEPDAARIADLKKDAMVEEAARLLAGSGWLPEPLRTPGRAMAVVEMTDVDTAPVADVDTELVDEPVGEASAATGGESAMADDDALTEDAQVAFDPLAIAAE